MGLQGLAVPQRGVAFVAVPSILGELGMAFQHESVAFGFRKNARRRNSLKTCVPLDLALVRYAGIGFEAVAVNEQVLGGRFKGRNGSVHS